MSYFIGATLALAIGFILGTWIGFGRDRAFYPTVMIVVGSYYVLFAAIGGSSEALVTECLVLVPFLAASIAGFKRTPWLIVVGLAAHGVLDFFHPHLLSNPGVPVWWPDFCLAYDVVAAAYLAVALRREERAGSKAAAPVAPSSPPTEARFPVVSPEWDRRRMAASCSGKG